ncbi:phosphotransferase [Marinomonas sp.]|nr:phosphotransferase [Marinomonas sp.]MDB4837528.1 phosphotransferase [Marinomonas sp.]
MKSLSTYFFKLGDLVPAVSDLDVILLNEGFSNEVYLLSWGGAGRLVLRLADIDCDAFYINRQEEMRVLCCASKAGLSPELVWADDTGNVACEFVDQSTLDWNVKHQHQSLERLAYSLREIHSFPKGHHEYSVFTVIEHYLNQIALYVSEEASLSIEYKCLLKYFQSVKQPKSLLSKTQCHNDLNPKNVLMDRHKLWLIDWEYTGVGDPLFDLAVIAKSHNLSDEQIEIFIRAYSPDLNSADVIEVIVEYMKCYGLREMAWLLLKYLITPADDAPSSLQQYYSFKASPNLNPFYNHQDDSA